MNRMTLCLCGSASAGADTDAQLKSRAQELARKLLLIDTHVDTPYELHKEMRDISMRSDKGHFDYVRARQGGLDAVFMAVYVPPDYEDKGGARAFAEQTIGEICSYAQKWPGQFVLASSVEEIKAQFGSGRVSLLIAIENGSALEGDLKNVKRFYDRGVRYITLTHSKNNQICDSSFDEAPKWHGLSPFGKQVIAEMNRLGMIIDVSHASDEAFDQIIDLSKAPVVATHSSCRHFTPGWHRNMSDEMIRALGDKGGVIQINFGSIFIDATVNREFEKLREEIKRHVETHNLQGDERNDYTRRRFMETQFSRAHVSQVADHIDHVVKLVGIDHVGLGSDFDGVEQLPDGLQDVSGYPNLIYELLKRGYTEPDLKKICAENFLRTWTEILQATNSK
ncbi:MAG: peptidase M19 [Planctomycetes bacterium RBG_13_60_9]|nr:MAG: peptidase M19 [Planctomycetes bacterium RBG_13_60_9]